MKILIVDDEIDIVNFLKKGLEESGFETSVAYDGEMAVRQVANGNFDLVLLDIILPKLNGHQVCVKLRKELGFENTIIMLTALGSSDDIVEGLDIGADDYLVKPVKFQELLARINAHSRKRDYGGSTRKLAMADLEVDLDTKEVYRAGNLIKLTAKEFNLLVYMLSNKKKVLSRMQILEKVWQLNFDLGTNVIDVYMNYLRKKVDKNYDVKLIHTVVGMGYVMKEGEH